MGDCQVVDASSLPLAIGRGNGGPVSNGVDRGVAGWKERLRLHPDQLGELEREVHTTFSRGPIWWP